MTIKAILFDMDGVLIDARDWHYDALNNALNHFGYSISCESHLSTFDGLPTRVKLEMLSISSGLPLGLHDLLNNLKQNYTLEISHARCKPIFIHQYALSRLKKLDLKLAVCSNSVRTTVETLMELSKLDRYLDLLLSSNDVTIPKPSPEIYLKAMEILNVNPSESLILEDNDHGLKAAYDSGAHVMRINSPRDVSFYNISQFLKNIH